MDKSQAKKNTVSQKILETTRETEKLKQELEALIASGIRGRSAIVPSTSQVTPIESSNNKVQIIKSYDSKHSQHVNKPLDPATVEPQALSPKKPKTYNVEEAREYIKRQRGKRIEELKNKKSYTQISAEIRKEKLQELQQKANEIVKKNVEAKKSRSKSREPPIVRSRSGNREQPQHGLRSRSQSANKKPTEESVIEGFNCAVKTRQHSAAPSTVSFLGDIQAQHASRSTSRRAISADNLNTADHRYNLKRTDAAKVKVKTKNPNLLYPPKPAYGFKPLQEEQICESGLEKGKIKSSSVDDIADKPNISAKPSSHSTSLSKTSSSKVHKVVDQINISQAKPKINVLSNITLRQASTHVEDQEVRKQTPDWLQEQPQTDPYNFINTVKRQLKYAANERKPSHVDIGIQLEDMSSAQASAKSSRKTDLKSFISHKCLNLDPKVIDHIGLDGPTMIKPSSCSENDSDTSKNIPSISSESCSSLRRNAEFIRQSYAVSDLKPLENAPPNLNMKKVEDVRLDNSQNLLSVSEDEVRKIKKQLFKDSNSYSSDFLTTDLSKSRDSIISSNCAKVSPNKVPLFMPDAQQVVDAPSEDLNVDSEKNNAFLATESVDKPSDSLVTKNITTSKHSVGESKNLDSLGSSLKYTSLLSSLHPSSNASTRKSGSLEAHIEQTETVESQKESRATGSMGLMSQSGRENVSKNSGTVASESRRHDGIIELLSAKGSFTGSETSHKISSKPISEAIIKSASSKESLDSYKIKSDNGAVRKKHKETKGVFSKSESNIYADKENMVEPKLSLNVTKRNRKADAIDRQALMRNITIRSADQSRDDLNNTNEIHLKFEAEIHLLTDFNKSLRRFSEIEKEFENIRARNSCDSVPRKVLQNRDTQTSIRSETATSREFTIPEKPHSKSLTARLSSKRSEINSDNNILLDLTQASDLTSALTTVNFEDSLLDNISDKTSSMVQFSQLDLDTSEKGRGDFGDENAVFKGVVGMSMKMFEQLIKDEDARIENLKKVIKIREQVLLDRTRGELVYLEMQKKQLIETGKLFEASLIKKKQRGILLKHQQEKHEMQRLKQMQKEDSHKRKTLLKKERNQVKYQLLGDMLPKLKRGSHREKNERRLSGPLKVIQTSGTTTVHSETSLSKGTAGTDQEIKSITTRTSRTHSVVNILSETSDNINTDVEPFDFTLRGRGNNISGGAVSSMKKTLLMREQTLAKRRKTVEELLQWHKKLLDEEKAIEDLESKIGTIISKIPSKSNEKSPRKLQQRISERSDQTSGASMSQLALEILQPPSTNLSPAKTTSISTEQPTKNIPQEEIHSEDSNRVASSANYSTDFDIESAPQNSDDQSSVSSISQLIEDFSKIEDHLLNLTLMPQKPNDTTLLDEAKSEVSSHSTEAVQSQIEAQKDVDASVIVVEPSEHLSKPSDQDKVIEIQEIASEIESLKSDSDKEPISEQLTTNNVPGDITNSRNSSIVELVEDKQVLNEETSEVNASGDLTKTSAEEAIVSEDVAPEIAIEEASSKVISIEASEHSKADTHEPQTTETEHISSQVIDVESKASTNHEDIILRNEEVLQTQSEAPASSPTKEDVEEIEDYVVSNLEQPSTSRQDNSSPVLSLSSKEDIANLSEEKDHDSLSSPSSPSLAENEAQLPSVIEDDRHSFENKTDEEKAASLSGRSRGPDVSQPTTSSSRLDTNQPSESEERKSSSRVNTEEAASSTSIVSSIGAFVNAESSIKASSSKPSEDVSEEFNTSAEVSTITSPQTPSAASKSKSSESSEKSASVQKTQTKSSADIKKHVQDILNVSSPRGDKSPRMQDLCLMTYDTSPVQSPESGSPMDERKPFSLGTEAEELHRKQLAIEQEIKLLKEQQQKEAASLYIREIPNKPPPPYTPPSKTKAPKTPSIVPGTKDEIEQITEYSAKIIHKAYLSGNLDNITISDNTLNLIAKNIDKGCYKYVFDLCKEIAKDHYGQFVEEAGPSWLRLDRKPVLASSKPLDVNGLKRLMSKKLFEMFGVDKQETKVETAIMKWSRKKRDPVDEVLLQEMQAEEITWTNFDRDEAFVKNRLTNEIMEMLLKETAKVLKTTIQKKTEA